jgi:hypothetical protein
MNFLKLKKKYLPAILLIILFSPIGTNFLFPQYEIKYSELHFYVKLKGSAAFAKAGDFGTMIDGNEIVYPQQDTYNAVITKDPYFQGFGGEIGLEVDRYSVGIEIGYLAKKFDTSLNNTGQGNSSMGNTLERTGTLSVMPILVNVNYSLINHPVFKIKTNLGFGWYLAKYKETSIETFDNGPYARSDGTLETKTNFPGIRAGLTLQINVMKKISLFVEGMYRVTSFKDFTGDVRYEDDYHLFDEYYEGKMYYYINDETGEGRFAVADELSADEWTGEKAKSALTGFSVNVGIKITF